jgi:hypothetical protein
MENNLGDIFEFSFHKWTQMARKVKKKSVFRAHKGTNWKNVNSKHGYKRVKLPGTNRYILTPMSGNEKATKKMIGTQLGRHSSFFKK